MGEEVEDESFPFDVMAHFLLFGKKTLSLQRTKRLITEYKLFSYMRIKFRCMLELTRNKFDQEVRCSPPLDVSLLRECSIILLSYIFILVFIFIIK